MLCTVLNEYMSAYVFAAATGQPYESGRYYTNTLLVEKSNVDEIIANYIYSRIICKDKFAERAAR